MVMCPGCAIDYPEGYLSEVTADKKKTPPICGCCALEVLNRHKGTFLLYFTSRGAEALRRLAIEWRREHRLAPKPLGVELR
jgi:hypothetical protein